MTATGLPMDRTPLLLARLDVLMVAMRETLDELYQLGIGRPPGRPSLTVIDREAESA